MSADYKTKMLQLKSSLKPNQERCIPEQILLARHDEQREASTLGNCIGKCMSRRAGALLVQVPPLKG